MKYECLEVSIELTNQCDQKCKHCSSEAGDVWDNELSNQEIKDIIWEGKEKLGTRVVSFSGGDPLLRDDFVDLCEYVLYRDLDLLIYTCGVFRGLFPNTPNSLNGSETFKEFIKLVEEKEYDKNRIKIIISLEGADKLTHDFVTGVDGGFETAINSIKTVIGTDIPCEIHTCPMSLNYKDLPTLAGMVYRLGCCRLSILRLVPQGRCLEHRYLLMNRQEFAELQKILFGLGNRYNKEDDGDFTMRMGDPVDFRFMIDDTISNQTCSAGKDRVLIRANGECQYCASMKHSPEFDYGNIRNNSLTELWNDSEMVRKLREFHENGWKKMEGRCQFCDFLEICKGGCLSQRVYAYRDMYMGPDPLCPRDILT